MKQVNFLPESYVRTQQRRKRVYRQFSLIVVAAVCFAFWGIGLQADRVHHRRLAEEVESAMVNEKSKLDAMASLDKDYQALSRQAELNRELTQPVTFTRVLETLGELTPQEVAMVDLSLVSVRPTPQATSTKKANKKSDEPEKRQPDLIEVELEALAPSDLSVAKLVSSLSDSPLFTSVKMRSSRTVEQDGYYVRRFRLTAVIDLDREFRWVSEDQEVADAY